MSNSSAYMWIKHLFIGGIAAFSIYTTSFSLIHYLYRPTNRQEQNISRMKESNQENSYLKERERLNEEIEKLYREVEPFKQIKQIYPTYIDLFMKYIKVREDIYKVEEALHLPHNILAYLFFVESHYNQRIRSRAKAYGISQITHIAYKDVVNKYNYYTRILKQLLDKESYNKVIEGKVLDWQDTNDLKFKANISFSNEKKRIIAKEIIPLFLSRTINLLNTYKLSSFPSWKEVKENPTYNMIAGALFYNLKYLFNINLQAVKMRNGRVKLILRSYKHFENYGEKLRFFDPYTIYLLYNSVDAFKNRLVRRGFPNCRIDYIYTKKGKIMNETLIGLYNLILAKKVVKRLEKLYILHKNILLSSPHLSSYPFIHKKNNKNNIKSNIKGSTYEEIIRTLNKIHKVNKRNISKIKRVIYKRTS